MATTLVIGERGEGKTTLAQFLAKQRNPVTLIFEPKPDKAVKDIPKVYSDVELYEALQAAKESGQGTICFVPGKDVAEGFSEFCDVISSPDPAVPYCYGGLSIIVDEAWALMTANKSHEDLERLLRIAPREGPYTIDVFILAHRPVDLNPRTHFFSDEIFVFRTTEETDLNALRDKWSTAPMLPETVAEFPNDAHYVANYNKNTRMLIVWDKPEIWAPGN